MFKNFLAFALISGSAIVVAQTTPPTAKPMAAPAANVSTASPRVALNTNMGKIIIELNAAKAPKTVENFLQYVKDKHYDGTVFHRVIPNFMVQGGGFTQDLVQKPTRAPIANEADNGLSNITGSVAMARTGDPQSATAQFFINVADNRRLDFVSKDSGMTWGYAVFGKVVEGMNVVNTIKSVDRGAKGPFGQDVPVSPVIINTAELVQ